MKENIESDAKIVRRPSRLVVMTRAKSDSTTSTQQHQPMTTTPHAGHAIMSSALTGGNAPMVTTKHEKTGASVFLKVRVAETADATYYSTTVHVYVCSPLFSFSFSSFSLIFDFTHAAPKKK